MPTPHEVFDDPMAHWAFITVTTDTDFEGQYFDRKEVGRPSVGMSVLSSGQMRGIMDHVKETVSAFANVNKNGGLLVIGISKTGEVPGINHLTDEQHRTPKTLHQHKFRLPDSTAKVS